MNEYLCSSDWLHAGKASEGNDIKMLPALNSSSSSGSSSGEGKSLSLIGLSDDFLRYALGEHAILSVADVKGDIVYVNDRFVEISGYSEQELIGQNHRMLKSAEHSPEFYRDMWRTIACGKIWSGEVKNKKKDGSPYWVKATIVPFLNDLGKPEKYLSIRTDITETKAAETQKQQQISFDLIDNEIYMFWPGNLKLFYLNKKALEQISDDQRKSRALTPMDFSEELSEIEVRRMLKPLVTGEKENVTYLGDKPGKSGVRYPVEINIQLIKPTDEKPRFLAVVRDISERKKAEKAKSEFIATVSHELRTPLTSIKGALGLIQAGATGEVSEKFGAMINIATKSTERLANLVDDLLDIEKLAAGKPLSQMSEVELSQVIAEATKEIAGYRPENRIHFEVFGVEAPVWVKGDKKRLSQVLMNLLSNASKFSNVGGVVEVALDQPHLTGPI